jgi:V8-like Glu-specific endopeptidase
MSNATPLTVEPPPLADGSPSSAPFERRGDPIAIPGAPPSGVGPPLSRQSRGQSLPPIPYTSLELTDTTSFPNRTHGIVFFTLGRANHSCSATVVESATESVVVTAGHCVHLGAGGKQGWAHNFVFVPGYQDQVAPFGTWAARRLFTTKQWRKKGRLSGDVGAAALTSNATGTVESVVGSRGIAFNQPREQAYRAYGYPVHPEPKYDGESLWACDSRFGYVDPFAPTKGAPQSAIGCDMAGGSSGGGWVVGDSFVNSVISFGYTFAPEVTFGPYFGNLAAKVYAAAAA